MMLLEQRGKSQRPNEKECLPPLKCSHRRNVGGGGGYQGLCSLTWKQWWVFSGIIWGGDNVRGEDGLDDGRAMRAVS